MRKNILTIALLATTTLAFADKPIPDNETVYPLLGGKKEISSLADVEKLGLVNGATTIDLWSGHYWPHFQGSLAVRYRDSSFMSLMVAQVQYDKFKDLKDKLPLYTYSGRENELSPSEKYDLVVGDEAMGLTKYSWELGDKANTFGKVPTWRGICDGWSSATQMMPRPVRSVTLPTPSGVMVTFYPEDIKALGSLLYARAQENVIFLGKRCRNQVLGLFTGACDGTNPGAFHKALVNRVGNLKKTFIADVSSGSEVWNYPVKNYSTSYYNVFSDEESVGFKDSMEIFTKKNRFHKSGRRHKETYAIVGVKTVVNYTNMRVANLLETDSTVQDEVLQKVYYYDLELDYRFNVLGGEWYGDTMPDFIWAPNDRTYPLSDEEEYGKPKTAAQIREAAKAASKKGQPLSLIVSKLFEAAK